jgi:hypothetical protein
LAVFGGVAAGGWGATPPLSLLTQDKQPTIKRRSANAARRFKKAWPMAALPVLILGLVGLLGLDQQQGNEDGHKPEQHDKPGEIKFHGEPPEMFL